MIVFMHYISTHFHLFWIMRINVFLTSTLHQGQLFWASVSFPKSHWTLKLPISGACSPFRATFQLVFKQHNLTSGNLKHTVFQKWPDHLESNRAKTAPHERKRSDTWKQPHNAFAAQRCRSDFTFHIKMQVLCGAAQTPQWVAL